MPVRGSLGGKLPAPTPPPPCLWTSSRRLTAQLLPRWREGLCQPGRGAALGRRLAREEMSRALSREPKPTSRALEPTVLPGWALRREPSRRRRCPSGGKLQPGGREARLQLPGRRSRSITKAAVEGEEYIKITGTVIAFYINALFKSFPQCESPSLKRINSLHTNLFHACGWSIMKAPPSAPDQEASGCCPTRLPARHREPRALVGPLGAGPTCQASTGWDLGLLPWRPRSCLDAGRRTGAATLRLMGSLQGLWQLGVCGTGGRMPSRLGDWAPGCLVTGPGLLVVSHPPTRVLL